MDYRMPIDGSPLIPQGLIPFYTLIYLCLFLIAVLILHQIRISRKNITLTKRILFAAISAKIFLLFSIFLFAFYYLSSAPRIIGMSPVNTSVVNDLEKRIEVVFDRPVKRKDMVKKISPYTPGQFVFEDPVYNTHLYRKLVFYPEFQLENNTNYSLSLSNIRNFISQSPGQNFQLAFRTDISTQVLGAHDELLGNNDLRVTGTFPQSGWIQVAADVPIKIEFNKDVDNETLINRIMIEPAIEGDFHWEDRTLVFYPKNKFPFNTIYIIRLLPGIRSVDGKELTKEYNFYFATQEEIFRLHVPAIYQKYALSCEIASLRMALLFRGMDISEDKLLDDIGTDRAGKNGNSWGNPYVGFVGNVKGRQMVNGYGVFWDPVARAANKYRYAKSFENWSMDKLTDSIQKGTPVIVWLALKNGKPVVWLAPSGDKISTVADEHAVLVIGFRGTKNNPSQIILNDPLVGESYWDKNVFEKKWSVFKNSGVIVY